jgi:hypothetical protein
LIRSNTFLDLQERLTQSASAKVPLFIPEFPSTGNAIDTRLWFGPFINIFGTYASRAEGAVRHAAKKQGLRHGWRGAVDENMDKLRALGTFNRIVEAGSFSAVTRETNSGVSGVTRMVDRLEALFGLRLLHRTTRHLSLTEDGKDLLGHARRFLTRGITALRILEAA